ncbi:D-methionine ABC transporter [Gardnerella pickettii 00703Bmash]|nr:D-methionine ABC transporter [Gardnerella pickettii 00703Bmash]
MPHICFIIRFTIRSTIGGKMIQIEHLYKTYSSGKTKHEALKDINLTIESGEVFGILGSSGAGKSSLVRCINLLERPTSGKVVIDGKDITDAKNRDLSNIRSNIGMIFQNFSLFQQRTVLQNVTFPLELNHTNKNEREERAKYLLDLVGLKDLANRYPIQLSGGQQQRVAIARALANNPSIMLCDEATSALDSTTTAQILDLLRRINRDLNVTLVIITHSLAVARNICDRVAMIDGGKIVEIGDTSTLFKNPQSNILKTLIANENVENHRDNSKNSNTTNNSDNSENSEVK